jgi:hypothetical protein
MQINCTAAFLFLLQICAHSSAAVPFKGSALSSAARHLLNTNDCTVDWIGVDDKTTFESNLVLLSDIPNEHDTIAGT